MTTAILNPKEMSEQELKDYYDQHLSEKSKDEYSDIDLEVIEQLGIYAAKSRTSVERSGQDAAILRVRRKVQEQVDRVGMSRYISGLHAQSRVSLINKKDTEVVSLTLSIGNRSISIDLKQIADATNGPMGQSGVKFHQILGEVATLIELCANNSRARIEKGSGTDYSHFTADIKFSDVVTRLKESEEG